MVKNQYKLCCSAWSAPAYQKINQFLAAIAILFSFSTPVYADNAYVSAGDGTITVLDTVTNTVTDTILLPGSLLRGLVVAPTGIYVADFLGDEVIVLDACSTAVIKTIPVGTEPQGVAVSPDGTRVYVTNSGSASVSVIDTATNTVVFTVLVGSAPIGVSVTPDGAFVYVANRASNSVSVINTATNIVDATIPIGLGSGPRGVAITPDGLFVLVSNNFGGTISKISTTTNTIVSTIPVGISPTGIAITPSGVFAYVSNFNSDNVSVINIALDTVVDTIGVTDPNGIAITSSGDLAYVVSEGPDVVFIIDTTTNTVIGTPPPVGTVPSQVAMTSLIGKPTATAVPSSQTICSGQATGIDLFSSLTGTTFAWTVVQVNVTGASDDSGSSIVQALTATSNVAGTATYTVTPTANSCAGDPIMVTITVNPIPVATAIPPAEVITSGQFSNISLTSDVPGTTFSWTVVQNDVTGASDSSGSVISQQLMTTTSNSGTATYTITPLFDGCPGAPIIVVVTVEPGIPAPPTDFSGCTAKNKFLTQTEFINVLTWAPSIDPTVTSYRLLQNDVLVATIPASGPYEVILHSLLNGRRYVYTLTAVNDSGESVPVAVTLPNGQKCTDVDF